MSVGQLTWTLCLGRRTRPRSLQTSQLLLGWLKILGAGYLIYLGLRH